MRGPARWPAGLPNRSPGEVIVIKTMPKRCLYCGRWFAPYPRMASRQITCGRKVCRRAHKRELNRQWLAKEEGCRKRRQEKVRNRRREEGYWKKYRLDNDDYLKRNRTMTRERMRRLRARRREAQAILADPLGRLEALRSQIIPLFATQELLGPSLREKKTPWPRVFATQKLLARNSEGVLKFLMAREMFATRDLADKSRRGLVISGHEGHGTQPGGARCEIRGSQSAPGP